MRSEPKPKPPGSRIQISAIYMFIIGILFALASLPGLLLERTSLGTVALALSGLGLIVFGLICWGIGGSLELLWKIEANTRKPDAE